MGDVTALDMDAEYRRLFASWQTLAAAYLNQLPAEEKTAEELRLSVKFVHFKEVCPPAPPVPLNAQVVRDPRDRWSWE